MPSKESTRESRKMRMAWLVPGVMSRDYSKAACLARRSRERVGKSIVNRCATAEESVNSRIPSPVTAGTSIRMP